MIYTRPRSNSDQLKINRHDQSTVDNQTITRTMISHTVIERGAAPRLSGRGRQEGGESGEGAGEGPRRARGPRAKGGHAASQQPPAHRRALPPGGAAQGESQGVDETPNRKPHSETGQGRSANPIPHSHTHPSHEQRGQHSPPTKGPTKHHTHSPTHHQCAMTQAIANHYQSTTNQSTSIDNE
jgi:hypothetical protein